MNKLVVLIYPDQSKIDEASGTLRRLHSNEAPNSTPRLLFCEKRRWKVIRQEITNEGHGGTKTAALLGALA